ncbi:hypothetical protein OMP38_20295 [Cohnella ginsengisoli]|uniref:Uncharacterized protein n=1 Tax=Cohnella ginsengisoli TaxID=425004 RepID=A0A9X4QNM0_9BACL|nr:hypothetical protein [Cohnella ginsengisoli]MDG0792948.1 hypothetical protein [Cohnella ginsengisoli]
MNIEANTSAIERDGKSERADELLQDILQATRQVVPLSLSVTEPRSADAEWQDEWGVLIGVTGDIYGRVVILGEGDVFGRLGESMFGMLLEGGDAAFFRRGAGQYGHGTGSDARFRQRL